jgi:hypothetical protein
MTSFSDDTRTRDLNLHGKPGRNFTPNVAVHVGHSKLLDFSSQIASNFFFFFNILEAIFFSLLFYNRSYGNILKYMIIFSTLLEISYVYRSIDESSFFMQIKDCV